MVKSAQDFIFLLQFNLTQKEYHISNEYIRSFFDFVNMLISLNEEFMNVLIESKLMK